MEAGSNGKPVFFPLKRKAGLHCNKDRKAHSTTVQGEGTLQRGNPSAPGAGRPPQGWALGGRPWGGVPRPVAPALTVRGVALSGARGGGGSGQRVAAKHSLSHTGCHPRGHPRPQGPGGVRVRVRVRTSWPDLASTKICGPWVRRSTDPRHRGKCAIVGRFGEGSHSNPPSCWAPKKPKMQKGPRKLQLCEDSLFLFPKLPGCRKSDQILPFVAHFCTPEGQKALLSSG